MGSGSFKRSSIAPPNQYCDWGNEGSDKRERNSVERNYHVTFVS